ncbi:putative RNA-directed DNA polymerase from transposon X-element [Diplonema papillatum]|nr:putative RNA-directed DNA polymerase from transposon X-element [Diplonema papillatum]
MLALIGWWLCTTPPDGGDASAFMWEDRRAMPDVGRLDSCAGLSKCAGAQERAGNDTEPVEVPLTRPTTITSVGWIAHEITNFAAMTSVVPVATCSVVVRMAAGPTVVPAIDAPPSAVPQTAAPALGTFGGVSEVNIFRHGRCEEDGIVEFRCEGRPRLVDNPLPHVAHVLVPVVHVPEARGVPDLMSNPTSIADGPDSAKTFSFSTSFAATVSDVPVATCSVVVRMAAGPTVVPTTDAPPSAVPQTAAPAPCTSGGIQEFGNCYYTPAYAPAGCAAGLHCRGIPGSSDFPSHSEARIPGPALAEKILAGLHLLGDRSGPAPAGKPLAGGLTIAAVDHPEDESVMDVDVAVSAEEEEDAASDTPSEHPPPQPADPPCAQPDALAAAVSQVMALSEQLRSNYKDAVAKTETDLCSGFRSITEGMNAKFDNLAAEIRAQSVALANTRSELSADIQRRGTEAENSHRELSEAVKHQSVALELTRDKLTTFEHDRDRRSKRPSGRERGRSLDRGEAPSRTDADLTHQSMPSAGQTPPAQETVPVESPPRPLQQWLPHRSHPLRGPLGEGAEWSLYEWHTHLPAPTARTFHAPGGPGNPLPKNHAPAPAAGSAARRGQVPSGRSQLPASVDTPNPERTLTFVSFNCRSFWAREYFPGGLDGISRLVDSFFPNLPDVILLQETWLSSKSLPPLLNGYRTFRRDRPEGHGGGVLIFVRTSLLATEIRPPNFGADSLMECLAVRITRIGLPPLHVYNVYRPPRGHASLCMTPFPMDDNVIIAGDLNAHHPDWSTGAENVGGRILRDWLLETSAITWNDPTVSTMVHRSHARYSSPDVVISTPTPGNILNWRPLASWGSDHLPIAFEVPRGYSQPRVPRLSWFSWRRADWDGMMEYLDEESSALLGKRPATNTQFAKRVASTFRRAIHQFVPRYRPGRPQKDWWTPELTVLERLKKAALSDLRSDPDAPQAQRAYSDAAAGFTHAAKLAKAAHWCSFASRINRCTDIGLLFRFVRKIDGRALRRDIPPIRHGDTFCVTADGKTELFGDHLRRVCGGPATSTTSPQWVPRCRPSSDDAGCGPITAAELDRALSNLDAKTSLDPDGLCCEFLRRLTGSATDLVLELLNISWEEGFVPDSWHNAHVVPVQKPGRDRSLPEGYRPISLTSIISKLMEVIVKNRLEFLTESPDYPQILPFCARQGGFRKGRGTEEQLFSVVSALDWAKTRLQHFCLLSFDLANAFDTVDHQRLLCILERRGIPAKFLRWIEAFLRNRKAAYKLDGATGRYFDLKTGVPQGTVLGPLLFLYYIDDLGTELEQLRRHIHQDNVGASITFSLYADDDGVAVEARTFAALERDTDVVDVVERWTENALMVLSKRKTKGVHFLGRNAVPGPPPKIVFKSTQLDIPVPAEDVRRLVSEERKIVGLGAPHDGKTVVCVVRKASGGTLLRVVEELQWVDSVRLLGLTIDRELTFHPHLRRVIEVFSLRLNFLRHLAGKDYCFNGTILRTLYLTYVLPTFTYALGIYGPYILFAAGLLATLGRLHRRALALILGCRKGTSAFAAQQESGILPIRSLVEYKIAALRERLRISRSLSA